VEANYSTIGGGRNHLIQNSTGFSTIGGGDANSIQAGAYSATIAGGAGQTIDTNSMASAIGGGQANSILNSAPSATISGGSHNTIQTNAIAASISGGVFNTIQTSAFNANIGGGYEDTGLSDLALEWLRSKAEACGLVFDPAEIAALNISPRWNGELRNSKTGLYVLTRDFNRPIGATGAGGHESVSESALQRYRNDATYRPPELAKYLQAATPVPGATGSS